jgi:hypothetical protein
MATPSFLCMAQFPRSLLGTDNESVDGSGLPRDRKVNRAFELATSKFSFLASNSMCECLGWVRSGQASPCIIQHFCTSP